MNNKLFKAFMCILICTCNALDASETQVSVQKKSLHFMHSNVKNNALENVSRSPISVTCLLRHNIRPTRSFNKKKKKKRFILPERPPLETIDEVSECFLDDEVSECFLDNNDDNELLQLLDNNGDELLHFSQNNLQTPSPHRMKALFCAIENKNLIDIADLTRDLARDGKLSPCIVPHIESTVVAAKTYRKIYQAISPQDKILFNQVGEDLNNIRKAVTYAQVMASGKMQELQNELVRTDINSFKKIQVQRKIDRMLEPHI